MSKILMICLRPLSFLVSLVFEMSHGFCASYTLPKPCISELTRISDTQLSYQYLISSFELKLDHSPFLLAFSPRCIEAGNPSLLGAPNFRSVGPFQIYGVAQPSVSGTKNVVEWLKNKKHIKKITWINLRQELVLTTGDETFTITSPADPLNNPIDPVANDSNVIQSEAWFSKEIQKLLVDHKTLEFREEEDWITRSTSISTYAREIASYQKLEPSLNWIRLSNPDMHALSLETINTILNLAKTQANDPGSALVLNCHFGHGRTTTAMILAYLMQNTQLSEAQGTRLDWQKIPLFKWLEPLIPKGEKALQVLDRASKDAGLVLDMTEDLIGKLKEDQPVKLNPALRRYVHLWLASAYVLNNHTTSFSGPTFSQWLNSNPKLLAILKLLEDIALSPYELQNLNPKELKSELSKELAHLRAKKKSNTLTIQDRSDFLGKIEARMQYLGIQYTRSNSGDFEITPRSETTSSRLNQIAFQISKKWGVKLTLQLDQLLTAKGAYSRKRSILSVDLASIESGIPSPTLLHELRHGFYHQREKNGLPSFLSGRIRFESSLSGLGLYSKGFRLEELSTHSKQLLNILNSKLKQGAPVTAFSSLAIYQSRLRKLIEVTHSFFNDGKLVNETSDANENPVLGSWDGIQDSAIIQNFLSWTDELQAELDAADALLLSLLKGGSNQGEMDLLRTTYSRISTLASEF